MTRKRIVIALISVMNVGCIFFGIVYAGPTFPSIAVNSKAELARRSVSENPRLSQDDSKALIQAIQKIEESAIHGFSDLEHRRMIQNGIALVFLLEVSAFIIFEKARRHDRKTILPVS